MAGSKNKVKMRILGKSQKLYATCIGYSLSLSVADTVRGFAVHNGHCA